MNLITEKYKKIRLWLVDQTLPVIATYPAGEPPIKECTATPDFIQVRNVKGGDWILPKRQILKARLEELDDKDLEHLRVTLPNLFEDAVRL